MIVTRFAPSPTGMLHLGGIRTALFSWLQARRMGGRFILRIEDTDLERSTQEAVDSILEGMRWLGLDPDEGPYFQSARFPRYRAVIERLLLDGKAYRCYCTKDELEQRRGEQIARKEKPRYDGRCRNLRDSRTDIDSVIRFKNPVEGQVVVRDLVHGDVVFKNAELDDLIIARTDGTPTYNFCVVVDDVDMGVTHVIRGDDHLNNTPRQINMFAALGSRVPVFAHVPMILGADGSKLSKRHGAASVLQYRQDGFLPDALLNYLVRLGWSYGDQEIFTRKEMIAVFDIADVNKAASVFNPDKLLWLNQQHLMRADPVVIAPYFRPHVLGLGLKESHLIADDSYLIRVIIAQRERTKTLKEMAELSRYFFTDAITIDAKVAERHLTADTRALLREFNAILAVVPVWQASTIHQAINDFAAGKGLPLGKIAQPIRVAVTGGTISPPIDQTLEILGRDRALARVAAVS